MEREETSILYLGFNQNLTLLTIGTTRGFTIYSITPFECLYQVECGPISLIETLFNSDFLALVGSSDVTTTSSRVLMFWNSTKHEAIETIPFESPIYAVKMNAARIVVLLNTKIQIYDLKTLKLLHSIGKEYAGLASAVCALSLNADHGLLALPASKEAGIIKLVDTGTYENVGRVVESILAHRSTLQCLAFNAEGSVLASASKKGTVIRLWSVPFLTNICSCRRGSVERTIYHLCFSSSNKFLVATGSSGTIHIFKLSFSYVLEGKYTPPEEIDSAGEIAAYNIATETLSPTVRPVAPVIPETSNTSECEEESELPITLVDPPIDSLRSGFSVTSLIRSLFDSVALFWPWQARDPVKSVRCFAWIHMRSVPTNDRMIAFSKHFEDSINCEVFVASYSGLAHVFKFSEMHGGECKLRNEHVFEVRWENAAL